MVMAKKQKSGLGRGIDSLIPKIKEIETEVEEGISLEDLLKKSDEKEVKEEITIADDGELDSQEGDSIEEKIAESEDEEATAIEETENIEEETDEVDSDDDETEEDESEEESSNYTNIFNNDDIVLSKNDEEIEEDLASEKSDKNIEKTVDIKEEKEESIKIIEDESKEKESDSVLSEKEELLVYEVIETVEKNPRITLWSARSAAVLRYLRKTEPEFSISNEASNLIDEAIAEKYPEIWTLFNHL